MTTVTYGLVDDTQVPLPGRQVKITLAADTVFDASGNQAVLTRWATSDANGVITLDLPASSTWQPDTAYVLDVPFTPRPSLTFSVPDGPGPFRLVDVLTPGQLIDGGTIIVGVQAIEIGTVTTLGPGTQASADMTGAPPVLTLDLSLPTGPKGDQGDQGIQGVQGVQGPLGPVGINWRGTWSAGTAYAADDAVYYQGAAYFAVVPSTGATPSPGGSTPWAPLALQGAQGTQGPQGTPGATGATGPTGPKGDTGATGATGPQGPSGDQVYNVINPATGAVTIDVSQNAVTDLTMTGNVTLSTTGQAAGKACASTIIVRQDSVTGGWIMTWPTGIKWAGGWAPVLSTAPGSIDVVTILNVNNGATILGFLGGLAFA